MAMNSGTPSPQELEEARRNLPGASEEEVQSCGTLVSDFWGPDCGRTNLSLRPQSAAPCYSRPRTAGPASARRRRTDTRRLPAPCVAAAVITAVVMVTT